MKSKQARAGIMLLLVLPSLMQGGAASGDTYREAAPGYRYSFPSDHFSHREFQTEWWYYTGNLRAPDGRRFGFELTFFRQGVNRKALPPEVWEVRDVWLAHLALSDIDAGHFLHSERLNRSGAGIAGADAGRARVWNGNWQAQWKLDARAPGGMAAQQLQAVTEHFSLDLALRTAKPPVIHGVNGISQKAEGAGRASHYISYTRLETSGMIRIEAQRFQVEGESWMDHEFFTHQLTANQSGWDWFSLQFQDGSEVMLFQLRRKDGSPDAFSAGTYIDALGRATHLSAKDFSLVSGMLWTSPLSGGRYPIAWSIRIPLLGLEAALSTPLPQQELIGKTSSASTYWEGTIDVSGRRKGQPILGRGYLEMTGYAGRTPLAE